MTIKFKLTFKRGLQTVATVEGLDRPADVLTVADVRDVIETEQFLERLTGLRVHIEEVEAKGG